ncbi:MAG: LiaF domain-containing protein [Bacteroidota bacterium]
MNGWLIASVIVGILLFGAVAGSIHGKNSRSNKLLTENLSEPLNGAQTARIEINAGPGHLTIGRLAGGEQVLVGGQLQYFEGQLPTRTLKADNGRTLLTLGLGGAGKPGFRFPWDACRGGAYEWQILLNPAIPSEITAHSDGGNVLLDLAGLTLTRVSADTGGGNMDVVLPDTATNLSVTVKSGAGNVAVHIPDGVAARIHATSGLGKVLVDSRFGKIDAKTYQSPDYDGAARKVELTLGSGAGNVSVNTK